MKNFDVIVIGGGHAGVEAALASARIGVNTCLITSDINAIAMTPCNPSIGGPAKGIVVREIDALGGEMGKNTDKTLLQIKMLNRSKGPAVHSLRAQVDKVLYPKEMQKTVLNCENLIVVEEMVDKLEYNLDKTLVKGVVLTSGEIISAKKIIITAGTYMDSYIINGQKRISSGPDGLKTTKNLSSSLMEAGVRLFKLKTGTPPRVYTNTVDFSKAEITPGDDDELAFSFHNPIYTKKEDQVDCYLIHTNLDTHKIIYDNLDKSAMYSGVIKGVGPRYCPSIEDKLVRFRDKDRHQLFLEPESRHMDTIYIQGFSTSMPEEIQEVMVKSLVGLENAVIQKYGYAIEYDAIYPEQLKTTLELKTVNNLYCAGQINGTSGYEEAAGQGIVAGINAALSVLNKPPFILDRTNSYIGLMIDDLITKGTDEPYRLLTSRSEFRLYLRSDNADMRLSKFGYDVGLLKADVYEEFLKKEQMINELLDIINNTMLTPKIITKEIAQQLDTVALEHGLEASSFLKRPNISTRDLAPILGFSYPEEVLNQVDIHVKYEGYIAKVITQISREHKLYQYKIPVDLDYDKVGNLALEALEKLKKIKPETIGHASQIAGVNPADISVLQIYLEQKRRDNE